MPGSRSKKRATLTDVGKLAGVSNVAASAVLNGAKTSSRVSEESRKRILEAAKQLNYRPNIAARALVKKRMDLIGVAARFDKGDINHYFMEVFNGILEKANEYNQNTTVFNMSDWGDAPTQLAQYCDGRIDGMILVAPIIPKEQIPHLPTHTPFVALHSNESSGHILNIEADEEKGAHEMVSELIAMGHKRIMHIGVDQAMVGGRRRLGGYKRALEEANISYDPNLHVETEYGIDGGKRAMTKWFESYESSELPSAIFCANDAMAIGCIEVLSERNIRVGDQISVCGFDDTLAARTTVPQMSTIRQPLRQMGHQAVISLLDIIDGKIDDKDHLDKESILFDTEVVIRQSTVPPKTIA